MLEETNSLVPLLLGIGNPVSRCSGGKTIATGWIRGGGNLIPRGGEGEATAPPVI